MRALIIDDENDIRTLVKGIFRQVNVDCDAASNLASGLEFVKKESYEAILLDLSLPDGYGLDVVDEIRANQKGKLYIISAFDGDIEQERMPELDLNGFIKKPFHKSDILQTLS